MNKTLLVSTMLAAVFMFVVGCVPPPEPPAPPVYSYDPDTYTIENAVNGVVSAITRTNGENGEAHVFFFPYNADDKSERVKELIREIEDDFIRHLTHVSPSNGIKVFDPRNDSTTTSALASIDREWTFDQVARSLPEKYKDIDYIVSSEISSIKDALVTANIKVVHSENNYTIQTPQIRRDAITFSYSGSDSGRYLTTSERTPLYDLNYEEEKITEIGWLPQHAFVTLIGKRDDGKESYPALLEAEKRDFRPIGNAQMPSEVTFDGNLDGNLQKIQPLENFAKFGAEYEGQVEDGRPKGHGELKDSQGRVAKCNFGPRRLEGNLYELYCSGDLFSDDKRDQQTRYNGRIRIRISSDSKLLAERVGRGTQRSYNNECTGNWENDSISKGEQYRIFGGYLVRFCAVDSKSTQIIWKSYP